jgi:hypothetical protein
MSNSNSLEYEVRKLKSHKFLFDSEGPKDLRFDLNNTKLWADSFWRRKKSHKNRIDPEIKYLPTTEVKRLDILEIGFAYGRIASKTILQLQNNGIKSSYTGIELCEHFKPFYKLYTIENPILKNVEIVYDNFFTTNKLQFKKYDLILLPMNTFPSLTLSEIKILFVKIIDYLSDSGMFLFSTHKMTEQITNDFIDSKLKTNRGVEAQISEKDILINEHMQLSLEPEDFGASGSLFHSINRLSRDYKLIERGVFRKETNFLNKTYLESIIRDFGYKIEIYDDTNHSAIYGLSNNRFQ